MWDGLKWTLTSLHTLSKPSARTNQPKGCTTSSDGDRISINEGEHIPRQA